LGSESGDLPPLASFLVALAIPSCLGARQFPGETRTQLLTSLGRLRRRNVCQGYILIVVIFVIGRGTALADYEPTAPGPFLVLALAEIPTSIELALQFGISIEAEVTTGSGPVHSKVRHHLGVPNI